MQNNPIRYNDPTGHVIEETGDLADYYCTDPMYCQDGDFKFEPYIQRTGRGQGGDLPELESPNGNDTEGLGKFVTAFNGGGGGVYTTGIFGISGLDGECADFSSPKGCSVISLIGGNVPLNYAASYDVIHYQNLLTVTVHESYLIPGKAPPLFDADVFGNSTLLIRTGLQQTETFLGNFLPGNIAHPENPTRRDTTFYFHGKGNFPDQLIIVVDFGAEGLGSQNFYYPLPYTYP